MFDKFKEIRKLKALKDEVEREVFESEKNGVKVSVNGGLNVQDLSLNPDLDIKSQEKALKECLNDAFRQAQMAMAKKFSGII